MHGGYSGWSGEGQANGFVAGSVAAPQPMSLAATPIHTPRQSLGGVPNGRGYPLAAAPMQPAQASNRLRTTYAGGSWLHDVPPLRGGPPVVTNGGYSARSGEGQANGFVAGSVAAPQPMSLAATPIHTPRQSLGGFPNGRGHPVAAAPMQPAQASNRLRTTYAEGSWLHDVPPSRGGPPVVTNGGYSARSLSVVDKPPHRADSHISLLQAMTSELNLEHGCSSRGFGPSDDESSSQAKNARRSVQKVVEDPWFQDLVLCVILVNALVIAGEANAKSDGYSADAFPALDIILLAFFFVEIVARLFVYRGAFFTDEYKEWNLFDFVLVVFGVIDLWVTRTLFLENSHAGARDASRSLVVVRVARVLRIFRVLRVLRVLEVCPTMRGLTVGLINGARCIGWLCMFMMVCIGMYSIFLTKFLDADSFSDEEERDVIEQSFGSVSSSMFTLFDWLTFDDWSSTARIINARYWWMELVWISYFAVTQWTFLSLVTGLTVAKMEEERSVHMREQAETELALLYEETDQNDDHLLDESEFRELVERPRAQEALAKCGIKIRSDPDKDEIGELFFSLDQDGSGSLTFRELKRILKMMANNRITVQMMQLEGTLLDMEQFYLDRYCRDAEGGHAKSMRHKVDSLHSRAMRVQALLEHLEAEVQAFVEQIQLADE